MKERFHILLVDDEPQIISAIKRLCRAADYLIQGVQTGRDALEYLQEHVVHLAILDLRLPDIDGLTLLETIKMRQPEMKILILTGYATIPDAVKATSIGASDFLEKQYLDEHLPLRIEQLYRMWLLDRENARLQRELADKHKTHTLIGNSTAMLSLKETIARVGKTETSVLITGETGTGKELVAQEIHYQSPRNNAAFVAVDCAAINESTFESELFGHVKGAFTGAHAAHDGLMQAAHGGTLFFDEIGELSLNVQAKLLRSVQEREVRPVGSSKTRSVDIRVIAATNRDLEQEVAQGKFREDLYYRLNMITLDVPPLRSRGEDIILLFRFFLRQYLIEDTLPTIDPKVFERLSCYSWPGNVRELQNVAGHVATFAQGAVVSPASLPEKLRTLPEEPPSAETKPGTMESQERRAIINALEEAGGNRRMAAEKLDIGVATLYRKIKKYNI
ncbi:MAG: sigma-54-dependent transcriptional regulator [Spirochaetota bacterium]